LARLPEKESTEINEAGFYTLMKVVAFLQKIIWVPYPFTTHQPTPNRRGIATVRASSDVTG